MEDEFLRETSEIDVDFPETDIDVPPLEDHHFEALENKSTQGHLSDYTDDDLDADDSINESTQDEEDRSYQNSEGEGQLNVNSSSTKHHGD